jgi:hypothetical protein
MGILPPAPPPPKPRRWRRRLLILALLLAVAAWFAPSIAVRTGLPTQIARDALADFHGSVEIGSTSAGWFSPLELHDVVLRDPQGRAVLTAPRITGTRSLSALLADRSDLGEFTLDQPVVEIVCENGSTNLELCLEHYLKDEAKSESARPAVAVKVTDGKLILHESPKHSVIGGIDASVSIAAARSESIHVSLKAASPGTLEATASIGAQGSAKLTARGFPLDPICPLVKRFDPSLDIRGTLTADVDATWNSAEKRLAIKGTTSLRNLDIAAAALKGDRLRLAAADLPLNLDFAGRTLHVEKAELTCDIGSLAAAGTFDSAASLDDHLDRAGLSVHGDLDLAKLATTLPKLLRIRDGTAITDGKLSVKLASKAATGGATWDGELRTTALRALRDGKPIEWTEPLSLEFSGRVIAGHLPTFDKFICQSDFIAINAKGSPESFGAAANIYLDRLAARLGEFVDLRGTKLAGEGSARIIASRTQQGAFKANADIELKQFAFTDGTHRGLNEPALTLKCWAAGQWPPHGAVRIETGSLSVSAGGDTAECSLLEPIPDARKPSAGSLSAKVIGDLGRWMSRVRGFVRVPNYLFGGQTVAAGTVHFTSDAIRIDRLGVGIDRARFRGAGLDLDEPRLDAAADLSITPAALTFSRFTITSPVLTLADGKLIIETPSDGNLAVQGDGRATTDLNRLGRTLKLSSDPKGSDAFRGRGVGPIHFRWQGDTTTFGGSLDVKDFAYGDPKTTGISEALLALDLDGKYDETPDRLTLNRAKVDKTGLSLDAKGTLAKFDTSQDVDLTGTMTYDLVKLTPDLRQAFGGSFQASGRGTRTISLAGSLGSAKPNLFAKLTADAGIGWDSVKAYGFDMGPGEFTVKLARGRAAISPIHANFGDGKITLTPSARFDPEPAELTFAKGTVVDHAKLTPAACAGALGYALPAIANAAQAQGELSAMIDDNRIPLADVTKASIKGRLLVHKATVGPGPVITEIMKATGSTSTTMTLANEMTVPIRVENGRVYHENFAITVNGYTIKTSGSAGFDGSLSMVADVPIPGTFPGLKNNPVLKKALEGKIVKVPLTGTVAKPVLDPNFFQQAVSGLARDAMKGIGKELINKELEKLFPLPMPKK